ncbi:hypothetical protein HYW75_05435 [Candidatus Pacearchaeota archaeon]|nr:hypothetical protein [Candidatus Pacearchaeota archaeon]
MAQVADLSGIEYFLPILSFLVVFIIVFAVLNKTKIIGENKWWQLFVSFVLATIFVSAAGARDYVLNIIPWFTVLIVSFVLILAVVAFIGKPIENMNKGLGIAFVVILILAFVVSAIFVFSDYIGPYLPWSQGYGSGGNQNVLGVLDWIFSPRVFGAILLLIVSALVSWVLVKAGGEKKK